MSSRKDFDFYQHVYEILKQRFRSSFIPYHEVYSYLGRRFCLKKWEVKDLIKSMEGRGLLKLKKRGIILIEQNRGQDETKGG
jgi:hypothetical protein